MSWQENDNHELNNNDESDENMSLSDSSFSSDYSDSSSFNSSDSYSSGSDYDSDSQSEHDDADDGWEVKHMMALKKWGVDTEAAEIRKKEKKPKEVKRKQTERIDSSSAARKFEKYEQLSSQISAMSETKLTELFKELVQTRFKRLSNKREAIVSLELYYTHALKLGANDLATDILNQTIAFRLENLGSSSTSLSDWIQCASTFETYMEQLHPYKAGIPDGSDEQLKLAENEYIINIVKLTEHINYNLMKFITQFESSCYEYLEACEYLVTLYRILFKAYFIINKSSDDGFWKAQILEIIVFHLFHFNDADAETKLRPLLSTFAQQDADSIFPISKFIHDAVMEVGKSENRSVTLLLCYYAQNLCVNDKLEEVRQLLLYTQLNELALNGSIEEKLHFTRALCLAGLLAFKYGNENLTTLFLNDFVANGRNREALAQGTSFRYNDKKENESLGKKYAIPLYLHLNVECLEIAHSFYYMLNEVCYLRIDARAEKQTLKSHRFRRLLEQFQSNNLPPDSPREHIFVIAKALSVGNLAEAEKNAKMLPIWSMYPQSTYDLALHKMKEIAMICFLQSYIKYFQSISIEDLSLQFSLTVNETFNIVNRMISRKELVAGWDADHKYLYTEETYTSVVLEKAFRLHNPLTTILSQIESSVERMK